MRRYKWKEEEDQLLRSLISPDSSSVNWKEVQLVFKNKGFDKTFKQIRLRWINNLSPDLNHGKWTEPEQRQIFELYKVYGNQWKSIANEFAGRTDNGVKNMFFSVIRKALRMSVKLTKTIADASSTDVVNRLRAKVLTDFMSFDGELKDLGEQNKESIDIELFKQEALSVGTYYKDGQGLAGLTVFEFINKFAFSKSAELKKEMDGDEAQKEVLDNVINELLRRNELYVDGRTRNKKIKKLKGSKQVNSKASKEKKRETGSVSITVEDSTDDNNISQPTKDEMELETENKTGSTQNKEQYKTQDNSMTMNNQQEKESDSAANTPIKPRETEERSREKEQFNEMLASIKKRSFNFFETLEKPRQSFLSHSTIMDDTLDSPIGKLLFCEKDVPELIGSPYKDYMDYVSITEGSEHQPFLS